jgi:hypothetical protein
MRNKYKFFLWGGGGWISIWEFRRLESTNLNCLLFNFKLIFFLKLYPKNYYDFKMCLIFTSVQ